MLILEEPNSKKKLNNLGRKKLVNWEKPLNLNGRNDGSKAYKMINGSQRKQVGLNEPREKSSKPMSSMKVRMGWGKLKVMK